MDDCLDKTALPSTPAYVFDEGEIIKNLTGLAELTNRSGCRGLYSIKALPLQLVLKPAIKYLGGLSVSSLFEARIAKELIGNSGTVHITTPGLRDHEFEEITALCSHISFNSISQYQRLKNLSISQVSFGLRINPKLSFANDSRFDPCRRYSKLGVDIDLLTELPDQIEGLHFHTVFSNTNYDSLEKTINTLNDKLGDKLSQLKWLNLGGGYLFHKIKNQQPFLDLVKQQKTEYGVEIYVEPGKAIVDNAGYLVTTVIDRFSSDGKQLAILDTTVNHHPEIFEYQKQPELMEAVKKGDYSYLLMGSSCLAGDLFGEYQFNDSLKVGDRLVFFNVGAYSLIKANRFNGYNLPDIYSLDEQQKIVLLKQNAYENYREQWVE